MRAPPLVVSALAFGLGSALGAALCLWCRERVSDSSLGTGGTTTATTTLFDSVGNTPLLLVRCWQGLNPYCFSPFSLPPSLPLLPAPPQVAVEQIESLSQATGCNILAKAEFS